ncbi:MAG: phage shock protein C [Patescibacteria group bacterium]|jgi:phage shock protein C
MKKQLHRNTKNAILGGVCYGIAEHVDADPTLIRLLWVLATFLWGAGLLLYIVAWIIMPEK